MHYGPIVAMHRHLRAAGTYCAYESMYETGSDDKASGGPWRFSHFFFNYYFCFGPVNFQKAAAETSENREVFNFL